MAFEKRTWLARIGTGLNKFIIGEKDANNRQTLTNAPDLPLTQEGDVISAENLNDLEDRIDNEFTSQNTRITDNETAIGNLNTDVSNLTNKVNELVSVVSRGRNITSTTVVGGQDYYWDIDMARDGYTFLGIVGHSIGVVSGTAQIGYIKGAYGNTVTNIARIVISVSESGTLSLMETVYGLYLKN